MTTAPTEPRSTAGQITSIAWIYAVYGAGGVIACIAGAQIGQARLSSVDALLPALMIVAAIGAIRRKSWARWLCYAFSVFILPGAPLGTIVGGLMIYQLTIHRGQFRQSSRNTPDGG